MKLFRKLKELFVYCLIKLGFMEQELYTLGESTKTGEYHLFKSHKKEADCIVAGKSICKELTYDEIKSFYFSCEDEEEARENCCTLGRKVCGTCISDLYKTK
jgi:hypothetical protein